jgi:hypothetical protein
MKKLAIAASILILSTQAFAQDTTNSEGARAEAASIDANISFNNILISIMEEKLKSEKDRARYGADYLKSKIKGGRLGNEHLSDQASEALNHCYECGKDAAARKIQIEKQGQDSLITHQTLTMAVLQYKVAEDAYPNSPVLIQIRREIAKIRADLNEQRRDFAIAKKDFPEGKAQDAEVCSVPANRRQFS